VQVYRGGLREEGILEPSWSSWGRFELSEARRGRRMPLFYMYQNLGKWRERIVLIVKVDISLAKMMEESFVF
jgi:hypothetical protein